MRLNVVHGHQFCGKTALQNVNMTHPHLVIKMNKNFLSPRVFGKSFREIEDRGTPLDELNMKFNIHKMGCIILISGIALSEHTRKKF